MRLPIAALVVSLLLSPSVFAQQGDAGVKAVLAKPIERLQRSDIRASVTVIGLYPSSRQEIVAPPHSHYRRAQPGEWYPHGIRAVHRRRDHDRRRGARRERRGECGAPISVDGRARHHRALRR